MLRLKNATISTHDCAIHDGKDYNIVLIMNHDSGS